MQKKRTRDEWTYTKAEVKSIRKASKAPLNPSSDWNISQNSRRKKNNSKAGSEPTKELSHILKFKTQRFPHKIKYNVKGLPSKPHSYTSAFILENERICGIDYTPTRNRRLNSDKEVRELGWHENICFYNARKGYIENEHVKIEDAEECDFNDLLDFHKKSCIRWNISLPEEQQKTLDL